MSYSDFEHKLLVGAYYLTEQTGEDMVRAGDVLTAYNLYWRKGWINKAVAGFVHAGLSGDARTLSDEADQVIWLTAADYRRAEELLHYVSLNSPESDRPKIEQQDGMLPAGVTVLPSGKTYLVEGDLPENFGSPGDMFLGVEPSAQIPASDRLVTIDHNSPDVSRAIADAKQLASDLVLNNDVGNLSEQGVAVAAQEVNEIAQALEGPAVRMPAFAERAKSTLSWIGKEAAAALVGAAALALLALIAALIGFPF